MRQEPETTLARGKLAEDLAFGYLLELGLKPLARNYRCLCGEIDIIMQDDEIVVYIEVRYRKNKHYIDPVETIDVGKRNRIIKTSLHFMQSNRSAAKSPCRFDVITVSENLTTPEIKWIKNAFQA